MVSRLTLWQLKWNLSALINIKYIILLLTNSMMWNLIEKCKIERNYSVFLIIFKVFHIITYLVIRNCKKKFFGNVGKLVEIKLLTSLSTNTFQFSPKKNSFTVCLSCRSKQKGWMLTIFISDFYKSDVEEVYGKSNKIMK